MASTISILVRVTFCVGVPEASSKLPIVSKISAAVTKSPSCRALLCNSNVSNKSSANHDEQWARLACCSQAFARATIPVPWFSSLGTGGAIVALPTPEQPTSV